MADQKQSALLGLSFQELSSCVLSLGEPAYRGRQMFDAIYRQRLTSIEQISTLSQRLREQLKNSGFEIGLPKMEKKFQSIDGTVRYLMLFNDGQTVETVWMPEGDGGEAGDGSEPGDEEADSSRSNFDRATICVSSQVGCAVNCQFCLTAQLGIKRNLTAGEICGQVIAVLNDHQVDLQRQRLNLVFMGMGEPFLNYENFIKAVRLLVEGMGFPESRMTVSTAGIVPRIDDFGKEPVRPKLAISLNGSNDEIRERVMPMNRKWNLEALLGAARRFPLRNRERLTFEYVLLDDVNDSPLHAREIVDLLKGLRCKVNLIALNAGPGIMFNTPSDARVYTMQRLLIEGGIPAFIRRPRGRDIYAACGQLKRTVS
ncbi:MAG TPA: 23S rRNA (adenine(2503)-C(2))-methyltransferase RlmN [Terriglobales bacterium]